MKNKSIILVFVTGIVIGWAMAATIPPQMLHADDRRAAPKAAFLSGGERSVVVLEKISKQISTIDARLAAIETTIVKKK